MHTKTLLFCVALVLVAVTAQGKGKGNGNPNLARLKPMCDQDLAALCASAARPVQCLKRKMPQIQNQGCRTSVLALMKAAHQDVNNDTNFMAACKIDMDKHCSKLISMGFNRVRACLHHRNIQNKDLNPECAGQLLRMEQESHADARVSVALSQNCSSEIQQLCSQVAAGEARVVQCLNRQINSPKMTAPCQYTLRAMMRRESEDYRLNYQLLQQCDDAVTQHCKSFEGQPGEVQACLKKNIDTIGENCAREVNNVISRAHENYLNDVPLSTHCTNDAANFCGHLTPGKGRILDCLYANITFLHQECRAEVDRSAIEASKDVSANYQISVNCADEMNTFCKNVQPGKARVLRCLQGHIKDASEQCKYELALFQQRRAEDYRFNYNLATRCVADIKSLCANIDAGDGRVILCLKEHRDKIVSPQCKTEVQQVMAVAHRSYLNDFSLSKACKTDIPSLCATSPPRTTNTCLINHRAKLTPECKEQAERVEREAFEDIRLNYALNQNCSSEMQRFCSRVVPGEQRILNCLYSNMHNAETTPACLAQLNSMRVRQGEDYRLNYQVVHECKQDLDRFCRVAVPGQGGIISCFKTNRDALSAGCKKAMQQVTMAAHENYLNDANVAQFCQSDVNKHCANIGAGQGRVIKCLYQHFDDLVNSCKQEIFRVQKEASEDFNLNFALSNDCVPEIQQFCPNVKPGKARLLDCIKQHKDEPSVSDVCREDISFFQQTEATDYRLNHGVMTHCDADVHQFCSDVPPGSGRVLGCLKKNLDALSSGCKTQMFSVLKTAHENYLNDVPVSQNCAEDVQKFCAAVLPGQGRVFTCLGSSRQFLLESCRKELDRVEVEAAQDATLNIQLAYACGNELKQFCQGLAQGGARNLRCLENNRQETSFSDQCKIAVDRQEHRKNANINLNPQLLKACAADYRQKCPNVQPGDGRVIACLKTSFISLTPDCRKEMMAVLVSSHENALNDAQLIKLCESEVQSLCPNVIPGGGGVLRCLREAEPVKISAPCAREVKRAVQEETDNPVLDPELSKDCFNDLRRFCKDISPSHDSVITCLEDHLSDAAMSMGCATRVRRALNAVVRSYDSNSILKRACDASDVGLFCEGQTNVTVCLARKADKLSPDCGKQVSRMVRISLSNYEPQSNPIAEVCHDEGKQCVQKLLGDSNNNNNNNNNNNKANVTAPYGAVMVCLISGVVQPSGDCKTLVEVAKEDMISMQTWLDRLNAHTNNNGMAALLGTLSFFMIIMILAIFGFRRWQLRKQGYMTFVARELDE